MQRWLGLVIIGGLLITLALGMLIQPADSTTNLEDVAWRADYFANLELSGKPVVSRYESAINHNWAEHAPLGLPSDAFSARWVGKFNFAEGTWRFTAGANDGIRLWVDDKLAIDHWEPTNNQFPSYAADILLAEGDHTLKVEYYDLNGLAGVTVKWEEVVVAAIPEATPNPSNSTPRPTPLPPAENMGFVASGSLDVYVEPGIQHPRLAQIYLYNRFPILGKNKDGSWLLLDLRDGRTGWVLADFLITKGINKGDLPTIDAVQTEQTAEPAESITDLALQNAPNATADHSRTVPAGSVLTVLGRSYNSYWYLVQFEASEGWVFAAGVHLKENIPANLPFVE